MRAAEIRGRGDLGTWSRITGATQWASGPLFRLALLALGGCLGGLNTRLKIKGVHVPVMRNHGKPRLKMKCVHVCGWRDVLLEDRLRLDWPGNWCAGCAHWRDCRCRDRLLLNWLGNWCARCTNVQWYYCSCRDVVRNPDPEQLPRCRPQPGPRAGSLHDRLLHDRCRLMGTYDVGDVIQDIKVLPYGTTRAIDHRMVRGTAHPTIWALAQRVICSAAIIAECAISHEVVASATKTNRRGHDAHTEEDDQDG